MPNIRRTYSNRGKEQAPKRRIDTNSPTIKRKLDYIESQLLKGHNEHEYRELLNEYYTLTGTEYPIRESVEHIENKISKQQEKPNDNTAGPSKMLRRESTIDDAGTELTKPDIDGFILDCEERQSVIQAEHENAIENKETTNKTSGTKIIEISLDEEWIEEEDIACYDNITRTDRCAKLKLDNSGNQRTLSGTIKKKRDAMPSIYAQKHIKYASTLIARNQSIVEPSTRTVSSLHTFSSERKDHLKENNSELEEPSSEPDNTSARDVVTLTENGKDTTARHVTRELRLSTLIPLLTTRIVLSTCLSVISYVKAHITFDVDNIQDETTITQRQPLKAQLKQNFANYLFTHNIMNSRQYDDELSKSDELRIIEFTIQLKDLEIIKKTKFRQIYLKQRYVDVLTPRIVISNNKSRLGALMFFLSNIALQNQISVNRLKQLLCNFIFNLNHKKRGLILCGPSDSGKTFLANLLYSSFKPHEIGYSNCPTGLNPSSFLLQALSNCLAYRCDEMVFEHLGVIQLMKQLLEGSGLGLHLQVHLQQMCTLFLIKGLAIETVV
nr:uncharacterized protein LOC124818111 [Hydra vulgaris]